jgi:hypothetical protein
VPWYECPIIFFTLQVAPAMAGNGRFHLLKSADFLMAVFRVDNILKLRRKWL